MTDIFGMLGPSFGGHTPPDDPRVQAKSAEQMAEYIRRQGDPTNSTWELRWQADALRNIAGRSRSRPTMTLSEWDARRAAFNHKGHV